MKAALFWFVFNSSGAMTSGSIDFETKKKCEIAKSSIEAKMHTTQANNHGLPYHAVLTCEKK